MSGVPQTSSIPPQGASSTYQYQQPLPVNADRLPQDYPPQGYFVAIQSNDPSANHAPIYYPNPSDSQPNTSDIYKSELKHALSKFHEPSMVTSNHDRRKFIIKVYALLSMQLAFTAIFVGIVVGVESLREGIKRVVWLVIVAFILMLILLVMIFCGRKLARKYPRNYIALSLFTIFETYILAFICAYYEPLVVLAAAVLSLGVTMALTVYAFKTKRDFTTLGGIITVLIVSILLFAFLMIFMYTVWSYVLICLFGVILYGIYIVYDTQLIAGGRYAELSYDDYVIGALLLYIDIVGLFMYLLALVGRKT